MFKTARVTFQTTGCEPQTSTLRVFVHPDWSEEDRVLDLFTEDSIHCALDDEHGWGDVRRIVSVEWL